MSTPDSSHDQASASHHDEQLPEEPKTPFWLTALGVALLVSGGLGYLMVHEPTVEPEAAPVAAEESADKPPAEPPRADTRPRRRQPPPGVQPPGARPNAPIPDINRLGRPPRPRPPQQPAQ